MTSAPRAVAEAFRLVADRSPERVAVVEGARRRTFAALAREIDERADRLGAAGLVAGDRVALVAENSIEFLATALAVWSLDATLVTVYPSSSVGELADMFVASDPSLVIASAGVVDTVRSVGHPAPVVDVEGLEPTVTRRAAPNPTGLRAPVALVCFSSGTTSRPKAIMTAAETIVNCAVTYGEVWHLTDRDRAIVCLPMAWMYGLASTTLAALLAGGSVSIVARARPEVVASAIRDTAATVLTGVTATYGNLVRASAEGRIARDDLATLRLCISGGEPRNEVTFDGWRELTGLEVFDAYCASECLPLVTYDPERDPTPVRGAAGRLVPRARMRIVDDEGREVAPGDVGHALTSGPGLMLGYWGEPELTERALTPDGWYRTGDLVRVDADGYVHVVGRTNDLIIRGGSNISPAEVERALQDDPVIRSACVVGLPDDVYGQRVVAAIVVATDAAFDEAAVRDRLRGALTAFKVPSVFVRVDELPVNATGKVHRAAVRERLLAAAVSAS